MFINRAARLILSILFSMISWVTGGNAMAQSVVPATPALAPSESARIDEYLSTYYAGVVVTKTTTDRLGDPVSCVDIQHQPSMNNPLLKGQTIQMQPSPELVAMLGGHVAEDTTPTKCPKGSVEMHLPTRAQIVGAGSLKKFLSKYPDGSAGHFGTQSNAVAPQVSGHQYAVYWQSVNALGAQSTLNVWQPAIGSPTEFSLSQLWITAGSGSTLQTVEVGAHVYPALYSGNTQPRLFVYYTADGYQTTGCYNCGFVQISNALPIGGILSPSTPGGAQTEGTVAFYKDPATNNWTLFYFDGVNYIESGYFPQYLFSPGTGQLKLWAEHVEFGGEVYSDQTGLHTTTDMGSGRFPNAGYGYAAYQRNLKYEDLSLTIHDFLGGGAYLTNPNCYDIAWGTNPAWGSSIYFGGPGYSAICQY